MDQINVWNDCVVWDDRPKTMQEGMRLLADWFDAVYQDAGKNDAVQQDMRRWANEVDALQSNMTKLRNALMALVGAESNEELNCLESAIRLMPGVERDKVDALNAIHALIDTAV